MFLRHGRGYTGVARFLTNQGPDTIGESLNEVPQSYQECVITDGALGCFFVADIICEELADFLVSFERGSVILVPWKVGLTTPSEIYGPTEKSESYARLIVYLGVA